MTWREIYTEKTEEMITRMNKDCNAKEEAVKTTIILRWAGQGKKL